MREFLSIVGKASTPSEASGGTSRRSYSPVSTGTVKVKLQIGTDSG
jgi:hypothetical protein